MSEIDAVDEVWLRGIYDAAWAPMVRLATLLLTGSDEAEEIVQDALVALHRRRANFESDAHAISYLRASVVNRCRSAHRHRAVVRKHMSVDAGSGVEPESEALARDRHDRVMSAIRSLPQRQQEVVVLRYYSDLSEADIADTLGISRGAVKSHASRGMSALRVPLTEMLQEGR